MDATAPNGGPIGKDFYMEHPDVAALRDSDVEQWRAWQRITVSDRDVPKPVRTFLEASFPESITAELESSGFQSPTPIQSQSWPIALSGAPPAGTRTTPAAACTSHCLTLSCGTHSFRHAHVA